MYRDGPEVLGVTCVNGNTQVDHVVVNVLKVLQTVNRMDVSHRTHNTKYTIPVVKTPSFSDPGVQRGGKVDSDDFGLRRLFRGRRDGRHSRFEPSYSGPGPAGARGQRPHQAR